MNLFSSMPGLEELRTRTIGDDTVCVAVLDGPVDLSHPCFVGAAVRRLRTLVDDAPGSGSMSRHGTHVASLIFGQPGSPVEGVAPGCRGLVLPVFRDEGPALSQLDLARAIERAVAEGAHVISISGGERAPTGEAERVLDNALRLCRDGNVLVVAAAGNDGTESVHVPAARPPVLAVGATDAEGVPLASNNWGGAYGTSGVLALGQNVRGAAPGGGTVEMNGSSIATPLVAGVAALLLCEQRRVAGDVDPAAVREAILATAPRPPDIPESARYMAGVLDIPAATARLAGTDHEGRAMGCTDIPEAPESPDAPVPAAPNPAGVHAATTSPAAPAAPAVAPQTGCGCRTGSESLVYAIGNIDFDYGTESRRDAFAQQMADVETADGGHVPANPLDPAQLWRYLAENPWASGKLTWVHKLDGTPVHALEAETPVGMAWGGAPTMDQDDRLVGFDAAFPPVSFVHKVFRDALLGQTRPPNDAHHVARVSIPGVLTERTVRLFSGQILPVVVVQAQGLYTWNEGLLVDTVTEQVNADRAVHGLDTLDHEFVRMTVRAFLDKVYYQFRNLGTSPPDRALNYAATNVFQLTSTVANGFLSGRMAPSRDGDQNLYSLDDIAVTKSAFERMGSDCYEVRVTFFDPENERRARTVMLMTLDVSTNPPVTLAPTRQFLLAR